MDCEEVLAIAKRWAKAVLERVWGNGEKCKCECCERIKRK